LSEVNWADENSIKTFETNMEELLGGSLDDFILEMQRMNGTFELFNLQKAQG
jgi:hypothetical protein